MTRREEESDDGIWIKPESRIANIEKMLKESQKEFRKHEDKDVERFNESETRSVKRHTEHTEALNKLKWQMGLVISVSIIIGNYAWKYVEKKSLGSKETQIHLVEPKTITLAAQRRGKEIR